MATRRRIFTRLPRPQIKAGLTVGVVAVALLLLAVGSATAITISRDHHSQTPTATLMTVNEKSASSDTPTSSALFADSSTIGSDETTTKTETDGASIVQSAIPAIEAYYQDHDDSYAGMTATTLHSDYDQGITRITVIYAGATHYCIASTDKPTYYDAGPYGKPTTTPCSVDTASS